MNEVPRGIVDNRNLFSNYFLENILPTLPEWSDDAHRAKLEEFGQKYATERRFLPDLNEAQLEERFFRPLLRILGFTAEVQEGIHEALDFPDYALFENRGELDRAHLGSHQFYDRALGIAEVKRWDTKLDRFGRDRHNKQRNPSYQIWHYLRLTKPRWGILSNGRKWRLYHQDRPMDSYFEVDLAKVLEVADVDTFRYFYYFFRKEAFLPGRERASFLDRVLEGSEDYAREVGENLKENVYRALRILAQGFFDRPPNHLDLANEEHLVLVQQNVMRLLYRLLFILYAEGKELLGGGAYLNSTYSLHRLKHEIAEKRDRGDLLLPATQGYWSILKELFGLIDVGSEALGIKRDQFYIPSYNGGLFDPQNNDFLEEKVLGDRYLAEAVDLLARAPTDGGRLGFVDYSTLGIRHLGSIYEGLLEYRIQIAAARMVATGKNLLWTPYDDYAESRKKVQPFESFSLNNRAEPGEVYIGTHKGERRATGSYYTPDYIVGYIVDKSVIPVVEEKWHQALIDEKPLRDATLSIKIVDMAMGSGHFLVGAVEVLSARLLEAIQHDLEAGHLTEAEAAEYTPDFAKREVLANCIYGVDLNELAVELAKVSLWLATISKEKPLSFLDHRLKKGNSLIGAWLEELAFYPPELLEGTARKVGSQRPQSKLETTPFLDFLRTTISEISAISDDTREGIETKKRLFDDLQASEEYRRIKNLADVRTGLFFGAKPKEASGARKDYGNLTWSILKGDRRQWEQKIRSGWRREAIQLAREFSFFHWELEFPDIFTKAEGGFDAVIGNPPYVRSIRLKAESERSWEYYRSSFRTTEKGEFDIYFPFVEQGLRVLSVNARLGYILPNKWLTSRVGARLRMILASKGHLVNLVDFGSFQVFPEVTTYTCLLFLANQKNESFVWRFLSNKGEAPVLASIDDWESVKMQVKDLGKAPWTALSPRVARVFRKIQKHPEMGSMCTIFMGTGTRADSVFLLTDSHRALVSRCLDRKIEIEKEILRNSAIGRDIHRYEILRSHHLLWPYRNSEDRVELIPPREMRSRFPLAWRYLNDASAKAALEARENGRFSDREDFYAFGYPRNMHRLAKPKIIFPDVARRGEFAVDGEGIHIVDTAYGIIPKEGIPLSLGYIVAILNSGLLTFFLRNTGTDLRGGYFRLKTSYLSPFPIRPIAFVTPLETRGRLSGEAMRLYSQGLEDGTFDNLIGFVDTLLASNHEADPSLLRSHKASLLGELYPIENESPFEQADVIHDFITSLADRMTTIKGEINKETASFLRWLERDIGSKIDHLKGKSRVLEYDSGTLMDLIDVLRRNRSRMKTDPRQRDFQDHLRGEFRVSLDRLEGPKREFEAASDLVDQIVYRLYELNEEEVALISDRSPDELLEGSQEPG